MPYYTLTTPSGEVCALPFEADDITQHPLVRDCGYTWIETTAPAPDPAERLAVDKGFGQELIDSFVAGSRANDFDLAQTRAINTLLSEVELFLRRGSIGIAREALVEIEPMPLFPEQAKAYYLSMIDAYLSS